VMLFEGDYNFSDRIKAIKIHFVRAIPASARHSASSRSRGWMRRGAQDA
jgi:hypothetical protein